MKKLTGAIFLILAFASSLVAQNKDQGIAIRILSDESGLFASHLTYPFGTQLSITNPATKMRVIVHVGSRIDPSIDAIVEISPEAADQLGIEETPTWVFVEEVLYARSEMGMRVHLSALKQTGNAVALSDGSELIASHPSIAIGTRTRLTNMGNGKTVIVEIKGRIRASEERIIEISHAAGQALEMRGEKVQIHLETLAEQRQQQ